MSIITAVGHVELRSRDLRRSVDFYKKIVGLKHIIESEKYHAFEVGPTHLGIRKGSPRRLVPFDLTSDDIVALNRRLGRLGVHVSKVKKDRKAGQQWFFFEDPDGHRVHVFSTPPMRPGID